MKSPFAHILNTNLTPSDTEARQIRQLIAHLEGRIARQCFAASQQQLQHGNSPAVTKSILETRAFIDEHRALLTPARRMPPDIWKEVFHHLTPPDYSDLYIKRRNLEIPPLLCQICSAWRALALSMPTLWSSISVRVDSKAITPRIDLIRLWITRARGSPLSFALLHEVHCGFLSLENAQVVLRLFIENLSIWRSIRLSLTNNRYTALEGISGNAPLLERIEFIVPFKANPIIAASLADLLKASPRLRRVQWCHFKAVPPALGIPWPQLSHLSLDIAMSVEDCIVILRESPKLQRCAFEFVSGSSHWQGVDTTTFSPITLLDLDAFRIRTSQDLYLLFDHITLPHLRDLTIVFTRQMLVWPHPQFMSLLFRSSCYLHTFVLEGIPITEEQLIECLQQHCDNSLSFLDIIGGRRQCISDLVLRMLTADSDGNCLCPNIQALCLLRGCIFDLSSSGVIADMIESRWCMDEASDSGRRLQSVDIDLPPGHPEDLDRLKTLQQKGLSLFVGETPPVITGWPVQP